MKSQINLALTLAATLAAPLAAQRPVLEDFSTFQSWNSNETAPRFVADVTGDRKGDIVGFADSGVWVSRNTATGFAPKERWNPGFGTNSQWTSQDQFPRYLADVNNDGAADVVGFASDGVWIALSTKTSFGTLTKKLDDFSPAKGWTSNDKTLRLVADLNKDGFADIVGFRSDAVLVSINRNGNFDPPTPVTTLGTAFTSSLGWTSDRATPRRLADVNGDGFADIVGFGPNDVYVSFGDGRGGFAVPATWGPSFTSQFGWSDTDIYPRYVADVNGDGRADLVGCAKDGVYVALSMLPDTSAFDVARPAIADFGTDWGWSTHTAYPRVLGDVDGDGKPEIAGFSDDAVYTYSFPYAHPTLSTGARIDITPLRNGFPEAYLAGYSSRNNAAATGTHPNGLFVRALAIPEGTGAGVRVVVVADVLGFTKTLRDQIAQAASQKYGLPPEKLILSATHTHSGPVLTDNLDPAYTYKLNTTQLGKVDAYTSWFKDRVVDAIGAAISSKPSSFTLGYKAASWAGFEVQRSLTLSTRIGEPSRLQDLPLLVMKDASGKVVAILFSYACHPVFNVDLNFMADYPGVAADLLEQMYPGAVALFLQGAGGDINPRAGSLAMGLDLAITVDDAIAAGGFLPLLGDGRSAISTVELTLQGTPKAGDPASESLNLLAWKLNGASPVLLVASGGELVTDFGVQFKKQFQARVGGDPGRVWVLGYANGVPGYVASRDHLAHGTYEGLESQLYYGWRDAAGNARPQASTNETMILNAVTSLVNQVNQ